MIEIHLTVADTDVGLFCRACDVARNTRPLVITLSNGQVQLVTSSLVERDDWALEQEAHVRKVLAGRGMTVTRSKFEIAPPSDKIPSLQNIALFKSGQYLESHFRLRGRNISGIARICEETGGRYSYLNSMTYLTFRSRVPLELHQRRMRIFASRLAERDVGIDKIETEFVAHDDNEALDAEWMR